MAETMSIPLGPPMKIYDRYKEVLLSAFPQEEEKIDCFVLGNNLPRPSDRIWRKLKRLAKRRGWKLSEVERTLWWSLNMGPVKGEVPPNWDWHLERKNSGRKCTVCSRTRLCVWCQGLKQDCRYCSGTGKCVCRSGPMWGRT
jgi:hypothetical protein